MKIIMIEDNEHKRRKLTELMKSIDSSIIISEANSYTTGLEMCISSTYDLLILDMSMPTYDKSNSESGGRFRTYGGKEIIRQLKRKKRNIPFIIVSQYPKFSEDSKTVSLQELGELLKNTSPEYYLETIFYDTSSSIWKKDLKNEIEKLL